MSRSDRRGRNVGVWLRFASPLAIALSVALSSQGASAADDPASVELARSLFNAGAQAYSVGKYAAAVKAFDQAYKLSPRPTIAFSLAQAHRREYVVTKQLDSLRGAVKYFREYIAQVEQGGRREDATAALAELEPMLAKMEEASPSGAGASTPPPTPAKAQAAQLMISPDVKEAMVSLDGGKPGPVPYIKDVDPGPHKLKVTADGYYDYERDIDVKPGQVVPVLDVPLREKPARLSIDAPSGADVFIDGRLATTTPLLSPLEVPAGRRFIAVIKAGNKAFSEDITFARGEQKKLTIKLPTTGQRIAAYSGLIGGAVVAGLGVVGAVLAQGQEERAQKIVDAKMSRNITLKELDDYNDALSRREDLQKGSGGLLGTGVALMGAGLLLYIFDFPPPITPPARSDDAPKKPSTPSETPLDIGAAPLVSPTTAGALVVGRF